MKLIGPDSVIAVDVAENNDWIAHGAIDQHLRLLSGAEPTTTPTSRSGVRRHQHRGVHRSGLGFGDAYPDDYRELWGLQ